MSLLLLSHRSPGSVGTLPLFLRGLASLRSDLRVFPLEKIWFRMPRSPDIAGRFILDRIFAPWLRRLVVRWAKNHQVKGVVAYLHTPLETQLAAPVAKALGCPMIAFVGDPPEYVGRMTFALDPFAQRRFTNAFHSAMSICRGVGVPSPEMAHAYQNYPCQVVRFNLSEPASPARPPTVEIVVGYAGTMYARQEWNSFLRALERARWRFEGRPVRIRYMGPKRPPLRIGAPIEVLGYRSPDETVRLLAECTFGYVPYWLCSNYEIATRLSFPSKLAAYASAGLPVFFHGPEPSSVTRFLSRHPMGVTCSSHDKEEIWSRLSHLLQPEVLDSAAEASLRAHDEELSASRFKEGLRRLLALLC